MSIGLNTNVFDVSLLDACSTFHVPNNSPLPLALNAIKAQALGTRQMRVATHNPAVFAQLQNIGHKFNTNKIMIIPTSETLDNRMANSFRVIAGETEVIWGTNMMHYERLPILPATTQIFPPLKSKCVIL